MHYLPEIAIHTHTHMDNAQQLSSHTVSKTIWIKHNCNFILSYYKKSAAELDSLFLG